VRVKIEVHTDLVVEIDDGWFEEAGARGFRATTPAYGALPDPELLEFPVLAVPLAQIVPPRRDPGYQWFHHDRMVRILKGIVSGNTLPTVPVHVPPTASAETPYALRNGLHRYYASRALGFTHLPLSVLPYFDINDPNC